MPKKFYVGGPICREDHYYVSRDDEINSIVQKLLSHNNFVLLHAHRQAGKSSLLLSITELLEEKEHVVLNISPQGIGSDDNFWKSLCERIHIVIVSKVSNSMMLPDS
jgi:energy-coupling factor transporter ATP-binding protein EcfA2